MPFTPYHFGPAVFLGLLLNRFLNLSTFVVASVILDVEPFLVLFFNLDYPLHGFFHSFLGASLVAVILAFVIVILNKKVQNLTVPFKIKQNFSKKAILLASFFGVYLHILFDAPLYTDIKPFYPYVFNPFYNVLTGFAIYQLCALLFFIGLCMFLYRLFGTK